MRRKRIRYLLDFLGLASGFFFVSGIRRDGWILAIGALALFLGVTDFGRQCPLLLSLRYQITRIKTKKLEPTLTAKPADDGDEAAHSSNVR